MSRSTQNFLPPRNWGSRQDNGVYPARPRSWNGIQPAFPPYVPTRVLLVGHAYRQNPGEAFQDSWSLFEESFTSRPVEVARSPREHYIANQTVILDNDATVPYPRRMWTPSNAPPSINVHWNTRAPREESRLNADEQKEALNKLKKEIYYPMQKKGKMPNLYYRDYDLNNIRGAKKESDEDGKRCAICLDDFEAREVVTVTPCKHMFHEDCIFPWVKSQGRCPVCRFTIYEKLGGNAAVSDSAAADYAFENNLVSMIRAMDQAFISERRGLYLP